MSDVRYSWLKQCNVLARAYSTQSTRKRTNCILTQHKDRQLFQGTYCTLKLSVRSWWHDYIMVNICILPKLNNMDSDISDRWMEGKTGPAKPFNLLHIFKFGKQWLWRLHDCENSIEHWKWKNQIENWSKVHPTTIRHYNLIVYVFLIWVKPVRRNYYSFKQILSFILQHSPERQS